MKQNTKKKLNWISEPIDPKHPKYWEDVFAKIDRKRIWKIRGLTALTVIALALSAGLYLRYGYGARDPIMRGEEVRASTKALLAEVGALIVLPTDEDPTIATVADPEKLSGQEFFANAKTGHKVIIYSKIGKAILYDPEAKKIVEVAPFSPPNVDETP